MKRIRVAELFAGVGGFRVGLEVANQQIGRPVFDVSFSNQWEPSARRQHASDVYVARFGSEGHSNVDIGRVTPDDLPDVDLVVGGFPCQDYSVATTLRMSGGLQGKKGVLWWEIHRLLRDMSPRPPYVFLENVDRLLKSPADQRGRDFAVMLASLADLDYVVEWRVINAADYGMPQRRRRVFILAYHASTSLASAAGRADALGWLAREGVFAKAFPVVDGVQLGQLGQPGLDITGDLVEVTNDFNRGRSASPFQTAGVVVGRRVVTIPVGPAFDGCRSTLGSVLVPEEEVPEAFFIDDLEKWRFLKGAKSLERSSRSNGHVYRYSEGAMVFPDRADAPSRTIITAEGGATPSRFKHVVESGSGRLRRLVPVELERLNMFPDDHTRLDGVSDSRRAFLMGNALVTGVVTCTATELARRVVKERKKRVVERARAGKESITEIVERR